MKKRYYDLRRLIFDPLAWQLSRRELHTWMQSDDPEYALEATQRYVGRGFYVGMKAFQVRSEIIGLAQIVRQRAPKVIVEIGTHRGGTLFIWCRTNPATCLFASIDLPGGRYGGGYHPRRARMYQEFIHDRPGAEMALIRGDSHSEKTLDELKSALGEQPVDFLFIDGDHTYEGVKNDFEMYAPLAGSGVIAFHDLATRGVDCGVTQLWDELKPHYSHQELVAPGSNKGIGVLFL